MYLFFYNWFFKLHFVFWFVVRRRSYLHSVFVRVFLLLTSVSVARVICQLMTWHTRFMSTNDFLCRTTRFWSFCVNGNKLKLSSTWKTIKLLAMQQKNYWWIYDRHLFSTTKQKFNEVQFFRKKVPNHSFLPQYR